MTKMETTNDTKKNLPVGWRWVRLGEVAIRIKNGTSEIQNKDGIGLPVTRIETISAGQIDPDRVGWIDGREEDYVQYRLNHGDILFSHINSVERLGNCAIYCGKPPFLIHGINLLRFEFNLESAEPIFMLHVLRSADAIRFYQDRARRAIGQASLNTKDIAALEIPLPPLDEQRRIVAVLREQMAAVEKARAAAEEEL